MMLLVRTTVTLEPDVEALVRDLMRRKGIGFKQAVNEAIRIGLARRGSEPFRTPTFDMGEPAIPLEHALRLAAELEDEELSRRLDQGT